MATKKRITQAQDDAMDRKAGIREGSPRDQKLDRARGLPVPKPAPKKGARKNGR